MIKYVFSREVFIDNERLQKSEVFRREELEAMEWPRDCDGKECKLQEGHELILNCGEYTIHRDWCKKIESED